MPTCAASRKSDSAPNTYTPAAHFVERGRAHGKLASLRAPGQAVRVLLHLLFCAGAGADHAVWRSVGRLSRELSLSESTIHRALRWAVRRRLLVTVGHTPLGVPIRMVRTPDGAWCADPANPVVAQRLERFNNPHRVTARHGVPMGSARYRVGRGGGVIRGTRNERFKSGESKLLGDSGLYGGCRAGSIEPSVNRTDRAGERAHAHH